MTQTTPIQYQGTDVSGDPILRKRGTEAGPWLRGRSAVTGEDALCVLNVLMAHLTKSQDAVGQQLLARIWRINSPIIDLLANGQERIANLNGALQKIGTAVDVKVGDDITVIAPARVRAMKADADLLRDLVETLAYDGKLQRVEIDSAPGAINVHVTEVATIASERGAGTSFISNTVRGALRLTVDGVKEIRRG